MGSKHLLDCAPGTDSRVNLRNTSLSSGSPSNACKHHRQGPSTVAISPPHRVYLSHVFQRPEEAARRAAVFAEGEGEGTVPWGFKPDEQNFAPVLPPGNDDWLKV